MNMLQLIRTRKSGQALTAEQMSWLVSSVVAGKVPDYQLATLLTIFCYEGLTREETLSMTSAFVASGETLDWDEISRPVVDKHSTGGVGDKVSLALAPLLAAAGLAMPKMSGRGLGHTGGTIDKLESIPGFQTDLDSNRFRQVLEEVGCAIAGQTAQLVPADKIFYSLRDATDNIRDLGLVAASVMSKKIAAGAPHIVLDVKCGSGAFFREEKEARAFAALAMQIGESAGRKVACVISDMSQPLGRAVGNSIEVLEVIDLLDGRAAEPRLLEVLLAVAATELVLTGKAADTEAGIGMARELIDNGAAKQKFREWVRSQGGRLSELPAGLDDLEGVVSVPVSAPRSGVLQSVDCQMIGDVARRCGAGRLRREDEIVRDAGLAYLTGIGEAVEAGQELVRLFVASDRAGQADELVEASVQALNIGAGGSPGVNPAVIDILRRRI